MKMNYNRCIIGLFLVLIVSGVIKTIVPNAIEVGKFTIKNVNSHIDPKGTIFDKILGITEGIVSGVEESIDTYMYNKEYYVDLYGAAENVLGRDYIRDSNPSYNIVKDNYGLLQFITFKSEQTRSIKQIVNLNKTLAEQNIPFLFVQAPNKVIEEFTILPPSIIDMSNNNINELLQGLAEYGVDYMDLRDYVEEDKLDKENIFYKTDHHWTTETALWATEKIVERINSDYGIELDEQQKYINEDGFNKITHKQSFLGSQGRRVGRYYAGTDDFTIITPNFETRYNITINKSDSSITTEGDFEESILDNSLLNMKDSIYTNRYAAYFGGDYPEVIIKNQIETNGKKVLIIKDSFALPVGAYLSTVVEELVMLDIRYNTMEDIQSYVLEYQPDIAIILCKSMKPMD